MDLNVRLIALALISFSIAQSARAEIMSFDQFKIDFTDSKDASTKASWSDPQTITVTKDGLGWEGEADSLFDGWIQTKPIAVGLSWRPTPDLYMRITIDPAPREVKLANGQTLTPDAGDVFARYSPDKVHWSSWQVLQRADAQANGEKKLTSRIYTGSLRVPYRERAEYNNLLAKYNKMDVPWKSDEEAAVKWILSSQPNFFDKNSPFIGYVEFLFETGFHGSQRIRSFSADLDFTVSGMHMPPKDPKIEKAHGGPWHFELPNESKPDPEKKLPLKQKNSK